MVLHPIQVWCHKFCYPPSPLCHILSQKVEPPPPLIAWRHLWMVPNPKTPRFLWSFVASDLKKTTGRICFFIVLLFRNPCCIATVGYSISFIVWSIDLMSLLTNMVMSALAVWFPSLMALLGALASWFSLCSQLYLFLLNWINPVGD